MVWLLLTFVIFFSLLATLLPSPFMAGEYIVLVSCGEFLTSQLGKIWMVLFERGFADLEFEDFVEICEW